MPNTNSSATQANLNPGQCIWPEEGTSQIRCEQTNGKSCVDVMDQLSTTSSYGDDGCQRYLTGKEILKNMILNIENQDAYLDQFRQLLQLEDYFEKGDDPCLLLLSIDSSNSGIAIPKPSDGEKQDCAVRYVVGKQHITDVNKPLFICKKEERVFKRKELFSNPDFTSHRRNVYNKNINLLIDLEESFTV